jgi:hypothetical protein
LIYVKADCSIPASEDAGATMDLVPDESKTEPTKVSRACPLE